MFKYLTSGVAVTIALVACTPEEPASQAPAAVSFATKAGFDTSRILGTEIVTIQSSTKAERGVVTWDKLVPGSQCTASSNEISATFTTPAQLALPVIKGQPSPLTITCRNGALTGTRQIGPTLIESNASGNTALEQDNIVAGIIVGAIAAGQERREARARDAWRYIEGAAGVSLE